MKNIQRAKPEKCIRMIEDGRTIDIAPEDFKARYGTDGFIRFWPDEFDLIGDGYLNHFNLQVCCHKAGHLYYLVPIAEPGYFDGKEEVLPIIDFSRARRAECVDVEEHLDYEQLTEDHFSDSLLHIKDVGGLKEAIARRYGHSLPHLSREMILSLGVSWTRLKLLD